MSLGVWCFLREVPAYAADISGEIRNNCDVLFDRFSAIDSATIMEKGKAFPIYPFGRLAQPQPLKWFLCKPRDLALGSQVTMQLCRLT